jgi:probable phosphoglycerate mutase
VTRSRNGTRYILVRHGETEWNRVPRFRGRVDVPLNRTGRAQAQRISRRLARLAISAVYASPLARTMETARAIAAPHDLDVVPHVALVDLDYGAWQGKTPDEVAREDPERYRRWQIHPARIRVPGGETLGELRGRVMDLVDQLGRRHAGEMVVLVSHEMPGRVLAVVALGLPLGAIWRIEQSNGAINVLEDRRGLVVVSLNDTGHLVGLGHARVELRQQREHRPMHRRWEPMFLYEDPKHSLCCVPRDEPLGYLVEVATAKAGEVRAADDRHLDSVVARLSRSPLTVAGELDQPAPSPAPRTAAGTDRSGSGGCARSR